MATRTRGQSDVKAVHETEVFTAEKYKGDQPTGGNAHRRSDWRSKFVRQMCSDCEVVESKGV